MKTTVKALKERINVARVEIIESNVLENVFGDKKEQTLVGELFDNVSNETELEDYIWNYVDSFVNNNVTVEDVFNARNNASVADKISEILSEIDNKLSESTVSAMEKVLESAGFRYMLSVANSVDESLLKVYLLDNMFNKLLDFKDDMVLDASEYGEYEDEETLLDEVIDELLYNVSPSSRIIQIEDCPEDTLVDFFQLEL